MIKTKSITFSFYTQLVCVGIIYCYISKISIFVLLYKPLTLFLISKNKHRYLFLRNNTKTSSYSFEKTLLFFLLLWKCSEISVWWKNLEWQPQLSCPQFTLLGDFKPLLVQKFMQLSCFYWLVTIHVSLCI